MMYCRPARLQRQHAPLGLWQDHAGARPAAQGECVRHPKAYTLFGGRGGAWGMGLLQADINTV